MIKNKNILKNTYVSYISQVVSIITGFLLTILFVRYLEKAEYGTYNFVNSALVFTAICISFGLESVVARYVAEFTTSKQYTKVKQILIYSVLIRLLSVVIVGLMIFIYSTNIFKFFNMDVLITEQTIVFIGIFALANMRPLVGTAFMQATLEIYKDKINLIVYQLLKITLFSVVLFAGYGLLELFFSWIVAEALSFILYMLNFLRYLKKIKVVNSGGRCSARDTKRIARFASFNFLAVSAFVFADFAVDNLIIAHYLTIEAVAVYSLGVAIIMLVSKFNPLMLLRGMISTIVVKHYVINKNTDYVANSFTLMIKICLIIIIPLYLLLAIYAEKIVLLIYKPEYIDTVQVVYVLAGLYLFKELTHAFNPLINAMEKSEIFFIAAIFSIYNLVMDIILVPIYGLLGAAIATGSAALLLFFYYLFMFKRYVGLKLKLPYSTIVIIFRNLIPSLLLSYPILPYVDSILKLVFVLLVFMLIYYIVSVKYKILNVQERRIVNNMLGKKLIYI
jgi:O-antigen/teichoic acid export membrane protein